jgi:hypothetical protein
LDRYFQASRRDSNDICDAATDATYRCSTRAVCYLTTPKPVQDIDRVPVPGAHTPVPSAMLIPAALVSIYYYNFAYGL